MFPERHRNYYHPHFSIAHSPCNVWHICNIVAKQGRPRHIWDGIACLSTRRRRTACHNVAVNHDAITLKRANATCKQTANWNGSYLRKYWDRGISLLNDTSLAVGSISRFPKNYKPVILDAGSNFENTWIDKMEMEQYEKITFYTCKSLLILILKKSSVIEFLLCL